MTFWGSLTLGLIAALIGTYFQYQLWKQKRREEIRSHELDEVIQTVKQISALFGKRIFAQREFLIKVNSNTANPEDYVVLSTAVGEWIHNFYFLRAQLKRYFGTDISRQFEYELHHLLYHTHSIMVRTYRLGFENLSVDHQAEHRSVGELHIIAARELSKLLNEINERIAISSFGTVMEINNIEIGSLDKIDNLFLIQRLFNTR
ncbi:MAG: hypothetical protein EA345_00360 [Halomonas sp.]|nr:hypothetical protein [Halomonas sp.]TVP52858.1 MAG: hypothetical protein EA345_00360 [Halomonas sp.]